MDLEDLDYVLGSLKLLGSKGTTGTQASFQELFDGDQETIDKIDPMIAQKMGFKECYAVSGPVSYTHLDTGLSQVIIRDDGTIDFRFLPCIQKNYKTSLVTDESEKRRIFDFMESLSVGITIDAVSYTHLSISKIIAYRPWRGSINTTTL